VPKLLVPNIHRPDQKDLLPNENFKMVDLPLIFETKNFEKIKNGEFIEDCFSKKIFLNEFFATGEPKLNYEEKTLKLPEIFEKSEQDSTTLEFAHLPKGACHSKKKIIALGESFV